jgi:eukaryotic-like serine/threonine-protein kinase
MSRPEDVTWEFGSFRLDAAQRLLFRNGELVPMSRKAVEILLLLLENHGQLVEKEELMRTVWPDAFVEESNVAVHISQLRKSLGADEGYRIDTIPRRGYRFVGAVQQAKAGPHSGESAPELSPASPLVSPIQEPEQILNVPPASASAHSNSFARRPSSAMWIVFGLAATFVVAAGLLMGRHNFGARQPQPATQTALLPARYAVVLGGFSNNTGDPVFDTTLHEAMITELEQSPYLTLIPESRFQESLKLMGKRPDTAMTPDLARELCQRNNGQAIIDGWIAKLGSQYVLGVRAVNCRTGDHLADFQTTAAGKELVLKALGDISGQVRARLGESLRTIQKFDTPIEEATTPSLEALQAYSRR